MNKSQRQRARPRIKLNGGLWYAFGQGSGPWRDALLVPAIAFCQELNRAEGRPWKS